MHFQLFDRCDRVAYVIPFSDSSDSMSFCILILVSFSSFLRNAGYEECVRCGGYSFPREAFVPTFGSAIFVDKTVEVLFPSEPSAKGRGAP